MLGVVYVNEVDDNAVPLVDAAYQSIVSPAPAVADKATVPVEHLDPFVPFGDDGNTFINATIAVLVADTQFVVVFLASA